MNAQEPILALLRAHVWDTLFGGVFFFVGFSACLLAAIRRAGHDPFCGSACLSAYMARACWQA